MKVPLTVGDFLERAETVYPDSLAVVDEPGRPGSLGRITYREMAARARGMALALDRLRVPAGGRVAIVSPNASRFMISYFGVSGYGRVLVPVNYRLRADEISYIVEHSGAISHAGGPRDRRGAVRGDGQGTHSARRRRRRGTVRPGPGGHRVGQHRPGRLGARRGCDLHDQLHLGHHRAPQGSAAHAP